MLEPWEGQVCLGSVNTARVGLRELRQRVAWLAQQPYLLPISIADNIAFGQPDASREAIEFAAHRANADDFIRKLPNGYDTVLGENAATLSGGQAQRIALARALLLDAGVIILDEPTASVDAETEQSIADQIRLLKGQKTVIVIAHRLSTIRSADRIAVLKDGLIVELGSHTELVEQGGYYSRLMQSQLFHDPPAAPKSDSNHDLPHA